MTNLMNKLDNTEEAVKKALNDAKMKILRLKIQQSQPTLQVNVINNVNN